MKLGEDQLPDVWRGSPGRPARRWTCRRCYDLYLTQWPIANAAAIGAGKPMIVRELELVTLLDEHELRTVLAHEAGHILSDHTLYRTALLILLELGPPSGCRSSRAAALAVRRGAPRVVPRQRALVRPRRDAREPRPADDVQDADGARRRAPRRSS